jgi:hypothetical protein
MNKHKNTPKAAVSVNRTMAIKICSFYICRNIFRGSQDSKTIFCQGTLPVPQPNQGRPKCQRMRNGT